ncbi:glycerate kinase [Yersinia enterocolitica]|nr:glycerate kinase [Yersinia enterocolitica]EKN5037040.1 glycerate kinase [Yersinia enterocolitica]EKN5079176.1 glycerate kinase [Yersinia enterocolitica]EKN6157950.1 glycerate kinase [Yersinia enterocolitica]EKN6214027.1 glycerate kinase [Yersinia enterocolitica]
MKIVIAPDSYKESLSALEVAVQIEAGFRTQFPDAEYIKLPVAGCRWWRGHGRRYGCSHGWPGD